MDMTPPQAPPALTQNTYQNAAKAHDRLVALQAWLATEQAGMPGLPDTLEATTLAPFLAQVDAFWKAAPTNVSDESTRRMALVDRVTGTAIDLALLAHEDGNLDAAPLALIRETVAGGRAGMPPHLRVRELMFGATAYAGTLLLQDARVPDRTLAFSTEAGWESFPTLDAAHAGWEQRARRMLASNPDLPGIGRQALDDIGPDAFVTSREIHGKPFDALVDRMIEVQRDKLRHAWFESALLRTNDPVTPGAVDRANDALSLEGMLDVPALLAKRHAALMETFNAGRLHRVPSHVAADWLDAEDNYRSVRNAVPVRETLAGLATPATLPQYATAALSEWLRARGIDTDPADIKVRVDRGADAVSRLESLQALFEGPSPAEIQLVDLVYQNISTFDPVRLSAITADGASVAGLGDAALRQVVRDLDLASRYESYIQATFRSGAEAAMRRDHASRLLSAHMAFHATEARLSYYLDELPASFRTDRAERGYQCVRAALDAPLPTDRARIDGHEVVVRQPTYLGTPLSGILIFGVRHPLSVPNVVLYTPDAPDGITFREFDDRVQAAREFFYHPAFREYLLDRLPADYARVLPNGTSRTFAGDRLANWVLGSSDTSAYTRTEAPFDERDVTGNFLDAAYEVDVQLGLRNAQRMTRSAEQANWDWLVDWPRAVMTNKVAEDALKGVFTAPARAAQAAWRAYDNVKAGDNVQAFVDFADFYNASVSAAAPVHALGSLSVARTIIGARFRVAGRLVEAKPAIEPVVVFEPRFLARGVRKTGQANREGIYTIDGKTYIEHEGKMYGVRHDADYGTWRLTRPHAGNAFRGPAIQRGASGRWTYSRVGLRGGNPPDELFNEYVSEFERAFPDPFERDLVRTQIRRELTDNVPATGITAAQRARWNRAVVHAHLRSRANARAQPPYRSDIPHSLVVPRVPTPPPLPATYRQVPLTDVPPALYYYGTKPFNRSALDRMPGERGHGFKASWAALRTTFIQGQVNGVRVTTVPPTATITEIRAATGLRAARGEIFAVRIQPRNGLFTVNERSQTPQAHLLVRDGGHAGSFVMMAPSGANRIEFYAHQHDVISSLPPPGR